MFFGLSKILGVLASPLNLAMVLIVGGIIAGLVLRRAGRFLLWAGIGLFIGFGLLPAGHNMMTGLEARFTPPSPQDMPPDLDGILVLGGAFNMDVAAARSTPALNAAAERLVAGVELGRRYPEAVLVFSGGNNALLKDGTMVPESVWTEQFMQEVGFDHRHVFFEEDSRNTHENLRYSMALAMPQPDETWVLVTSAWHMPRAAAVMQSMGWPGKVIYWPVDFRTDGRKRILPPDLDVLSNMDKASIALHERLGWVTYRLTGRINPRGEGLKQ